MDKYIRLRQKGKRLEPTAAWSVLFAFSIGAMFRGD